MRKLKLCRASCDLVPQKPGIYHLYDRSGKLIYTGRSQKLRHRISAWYQNDKSRTGWEKSLAKKAWLFSFTVLNGKKNIMRKEKAIIKRKKPKYNHYSTG